MCDHIGLEYLGLNKFPSPLLVKTSDVPMYIVDFQEEMCARYFLFLIDHEIVFSQSISWV